MRTHLRIQADCPFPVKGKHRRVRPRSLTRVNRKSLVLSFCIHEACSSAHACVALRHTAVLQSLVEGPKLYAPSLQNCDVCSQWRQNTIGPTRLSMTSARRRRIHVTRSRDPNNPRDPVSLVSDGRTDC